MRDFRLDLVLNRPGFCLRTSLSLPLEGVTVVYGASGSGKTSLLRCVAGLERADGVVRVGAQVWQSTSEQLFVPTWKRALGYVFQEASLFDHLNVQQNLNYGVRRVGGLDSEQALKEAVELLGIGHLLERSSASLSGGERQRVAIARALSTRPQVLLLDEPLASLDFARRAEILPWLQRLRQELRIPVLYVTHSADELARLADHLVILEQGSVKACGPLAQVMQEPATGLAFGEEAGVVIDGYVASTWEGDQAAQVNSPLGNLWVNDHRLTQGQNLRLRILAKDISLALDSDFQSSMDNQLKGRVEGVDTDVNPGQWLVRIRCDEGTLLSRITQRAALSLGLQVGMPIWCCIHAITAFPS